MRLEGKCVLITGAGSGIGRALAVEAARRGMTVALCGRRADALAKTAALLDAGTAHIVIQADVTRPDDRRMLVDRIRERWGKLDVLINNAGIVTGGAVESLNDDALERVLATNVTAPIALTRDLSPLLLAAQPSRVVNVGSMFGDIAFPLFAAYSASKFGLRGFSDRVAARISRSRRRRDLRRAARDQDRGRGLAGNADHFGSAAPRRSVGGRGGHLARRRKGRAERFPTGPERMFILLQRLFPGLVDNAVCKQMALTMPCVQNCSNAAYERPASPAASSGG